VFEIVLLYPSGKINNALMMIAFPEKGEKFSPYFRDSQSLPKGEKFILLIILCNNKW